jgi:transposase
MDERDVIIAKLIDQVDFLAARVKELEKQNQLLREEIARLKKNSGNSSMSPSSDIVKPASRRSPKEPKRKRGAQRGHKKHSRREFTPEEIDNTIEYELKGEQARGLIALDQWDIVHQVTLPKKLYTVTEHRGRKYWDTKTGRIVSSLPREVAEGSLLGADITSMAAYMKGACHMSYSTIKQFFKDIIKLDVSRGLLCKSVNKVSDALSQSHQQLARRLPNESYLGIDETGHSDNGRKHWTWCFQTSEFTFFHINKSRGSQVLFDILGDQFSGIIGCDYLGAYRKYSRLTDASVQFCMAHLIREIKFLVKYPVKGLAIWGNKLLGWIKYIFNILHNFQKLGEKDFADEMEIIKKWFLTEIRHPPNHKRAKNISRRFEGNAAEDYFRFLTEADVEPTNNASERQIRHVVIDRKITQGTRGDSGIRWCERIWSTIATCKKQNRDLFEFLHQSLLAHWNNNQFPSLL